MARGFCNYNHLEKLIFICVYFTLLRIFGIQRNIFSTKSTFFKKSERSRIQTLKDSYDTEVTIFNIQICFLKFIDANSCNFHGIICYQAFSSIKRESIDIRFLGIYQIPLYI